MPLHLFRVSGVVAQPVVPSAPLNSERRVQSVNFTNRDTVSATLSIYLTRGGQNFYQLDAMVVGKQETFIWDDGLTLAPGDELFAVLAAAITTTAVDGTTTYL